MVGRSGRLHTLTNLLDLGSLRTANARALFASVVTQGGSGLQPFPLR